MPPKPPPPKKPLPPVARPEISDASLLYIPEDAVEGFQDRIEQGIDWTVIEAGARHHKDLCRRDEIPVVTFTEALQNKINNSYLHGILDEESGLSLEQFWELELPITLWDNEKCANEEGKVCFLNANCITDDTIALIKKTVKAGDREVLLQEMKLVNVLRVNDSEMTDFDEGLSEFAKLATLNLCGNFIAAVDTSVMPTGLRMLELQANRIRNLDSFNELPNELIYLGLARNLLTNDALEGLCHLPHHLSVLDLTDNDIYDLEPLLDILARLPSLTSLSLTGNPCSVCAAYARTTLLRLPRLKWLDSRQLLPSDRKVEPHEPHPDDLRSSYFNFSVIRIMSVPVPPKLEKGAVATYHVELELPLLDTLRRRFLMFRHFESLTEMLPVPEDDEWPDEDSKNMNNTSKGSKLIDSLDLEALEEESDIYKHLVIKNSLEIRHFTTFESNKVAWNKMMNFQEPTVRIFCPDLTALRDTFRSTITLRLVYTQTMTTKLKPEKKSLSSFKPPPAEQHVVLATIKCPLRRLDWSQHSQHFHWDDSLGTDEAMHWGDGDLAVLQYTQAALSRPTKTKLDTEVGTTKQVIPDNLTCQFSFGIDVVDRAYK